MSGAYHPVLTDHEVALGELLVRNRHWRWPNGLVGACTDGSMLEVRGYAVAGLLPRLRDPQTVGHLEQLLDECCGQQVQWTIGRTWCLLEAGHHRRRFYGPSRGSAVAQALIARWAALARAARSARPP